MFICYYKKGSFPFPFASIYSSSERGYDSWRWDTFSPDTEIIKMLDLKIKGKTYAERKNNLKMIATDFQTSFAGLCWNWEDIVIIQNYFKKNAKKYGLFKEFKENGII